MGSVQGAKSCFMLHTACFGQARRGSALLLSLLIASLALAVSLNLAAIINLGISGSTVSKNALPLFYRAESGMERALYRVRQLKIPASELGMDTGCSANLNCGGGGDCIPGCQVTVAFTRNASSGLLDRAFTLKQDQSLEIDLLDTDTAGVVAAGVDQLQVVCHDAAANPPTGSLVVTATVVAGTAGWGVPEEAAVTQEVFAPCSTTANVDSVYTTGPGLGLSSSNSYIVNIRAVKSDILIKSVKAFGGAGATERPLSDRLELTSSGEGLTARQQMTVVLPGRVHASGLFDYALYSECGITKPYLAAQPCPVP